MDCDAFEFMQILLSQPSSSSLLHFHHDNSIMTLACQYGTGDTGGDTVQETLHVGDLEVDKQVLGIVKQTDDVLRVRALLWLILFIA